MQGLGQRHPTHEKTSRIATNLTSFLGASLADCALSPSWILRHHELSNREPRPIDMETHILVILAPRLGILSTFTVESKFQITF